MNKYSIYTRTLLITPVLLVTFLLVSCENNPSKANDETHPPVLDHVESVSQGEPTITKAKGGETVVIVGENLGSTREITFNGTEANIDPALVRDHDIIVTIPKDTPFRNTSDKLTVTNAVSSASLPFHIIQPPPTIMSFSPILGPTGDTLTIKGKTFDNTELVRFGDKSTGKVAQIVSVTSTQIKAIIPDGIMGRVPIIVKTSAGSTRSEDLYGFEIVIYADALFNNSWIGQGYSATWNYQNIEHVKSGRYSIKTTLTSGYGALQIYGYGQDPVDLSGVEEITFSVYVESGITELGVVLNGDYSFEPTVQTMLGKYKTVTVPLSKLGNPSELHEIVLHGRGSIGTFYIDNIGFN